LITWYSIGKIVVEDKRLIDDNFDEATLMRTNVVGGYANLRHAPFLHS
jgi:hypothetical protein